MARPKKNKLKINYPSGRVMHLVIFMADKEGHLNMDLETLQDNINAHEGGYLNYAFILHDRDTYNAEAVYMHDELNHKTYIERLKILSSAKGIGEDETQESGFAFDEALSLEAQKYADMQFPKIVKGQEKPAHWHIVLNFASARRIDEVARWFKLKNGETLEPNWVQLKTGRGALENALNYLVHKNDSQKAQYEPEKVYASFDYLKHLEEAIKKEDRAKKYDVDKYDINEMIDKVAIGELTLKDVKRSLPYAVYQMKKPAFESARQEYVRNGIPMPLERQVYYVDAEGIDNDTGAGGVGKSAIAKAYAKQLAARCGADKTLSFDDLREYIFVAGSKDVFLDSYDGQPVLFIDDLKANDLMSACKGIREVKNLLDPHPIRTQMNVKFSSLVCTAQYIIINGIESFEKFKKELSKADKASEQIDRRIWGLIHVIDGSNVQYWVNRGLFEDMRDLQTQMMLVETRRHNIAQIAQRTCGEAQFLLEQRIVQPLLDQVEQHAENQMKAPKISDIDEALKSGLFDEVGKPIEIYDDDFIGIEETPFDENETLPYKQYSFYSKPNKMAEVIDKMFEMGMYNYDDIELYNEFSKVAVEALTNQEKTKHNKEYFELAKKAIERLK